MAALKAINQGFFSGNIGQGLYAIYLSIYSFLGRGRGGKGSRVEVESIGLKGGWMKAGIEVILPNLDMMNLFLGINVNSLPLSLERDDSQTNINDAMVLALLNLAHK